MLYLNCLASCASLNKMDLRKYLVTKRTHVSSSSEESDSEKHEGESSLAYDIALPPAKRKMPCSEKKKQYKPILSYKKAWKESHPWLQCTNPWDGRFCTVCMKWESLLLGLKEGGLLGESLIGIMLLSLLKKMNSLNGTKILLLLQEWHSNVNNRVLQTCASASAKEVVKRKEKNCDILLKSTQVHLFLNNIWRTSVANNEWRQAARAAYHWKSFYCLVHIICTVIQIPFLLIGV